MAEAIRMPRMSDTMTEGNLVAWLKKVGDKIQPGDVLAEVETDKATMELESYQEGTLLYIGVEKGPVPVNGLLAIIGNPGEDFSALLQEGPAATGNGAAKTQGTSETAAQTVTLPAESLVEAQTEAFGGSRIKASPLARQLAKTSGLSLEAISGSGTQGRIVKRDILAHMEQPGSPARASAPAVSYPTVPVLNRGSREEPLSQMRKVIARRLGESKFSAPHFYLTMEIDMGRCKQAREMLNASGERKISFNDLVIKASAMALRKHPAINSSWLQDRIAYHQDVHIGVAVAVDEGLVVPVIRNTDYRSLSEISEEVRSLAGKAKDRKLTPEEMQGNTFTISNLGMFGIDEFTAIINPPDACILAVGAILEKPVVRENQIVIGHMMKVTLSCDHRLVDGATGARFLQTLKSFLEEPVFMLA